MPAWKIIWILASLGNLFIMAALIRRRAWTTLPWIWFIEAFSFVFGLFEDAQWFYPTGDYAHMWNDLEILQILFCAALIYALWHSALGELASLLPILYTIECYLTMREYVLHQAGRPDLSWMVYYSRSALGIGTAFLMGFCLWTERIRSRYNRPQGEPSMPEELEPKPAPPTPTPHPHPTPDDPPGTPPPTTGPGGN